MRGYRWILILILSISASLSPIPDAVAQTPAEKPARTERRQKELNFRRRIVDKVSLDGVRSFRQSEIRRLLYTKENHWYNFLKKRELSKSNVNIDIATIKRFYRRHGYLFTAVESRIANRENNKATVTFVISEGRRTYLTAIGVEGGIAEVNAKFGKTIKSFIINQPVDAEEVISGGFRLRDLYFDNGRPYAHVAGRYDFSIDSVQASIAYVVAESVLTVNSNAAINRPGTTRTNVVLRELVVKPDKLYRRRDVIESEQRLYSTGLFKYISIQRNDSTAITVNDTCHVGFDLRYDERKPYFINFGLGLGRQNDVAMVLRNTLQWGNRNIAGTGRKLILASQPQFQITDPQGDLSGLRFSDLGKGLRFSLIRATNEIDYVEPWILGYRVPATIRVIYEPYTLNPTIGYRYDRVAGDLSFSRELSQTVTTRLIAATEYISIRNVPPGQEQFYRDEGDNQIRRKLQFYGEQDTRDNPFVPQRGSYSFVGLDLVGGFLGGDFSYFKTQFSWSRFNRVSSQNILATRIWLGFLTEIGNNGRSGQEDRFLVGGATTIRGYRENSLGPVFTSEDNPGDKLGKPKGGRYLMVGNLELRRPLFWRFGGAAFFDVGNTYYRWSDITPLSVAFTSGLGVQFFTPIGPIRFDYGIRLKKKFDLSAGLYHLSILYAF